LKRPTCDRRRGRAGTGKSYLTNKVIKELKKQNKKYLAFSPTNKGARIIGGIEEMDHHLNYRIMRSLNVIDHLCVFMLFN
jgi:Cdc6-like AAA superfamily ATPase